MPRKRTTAEKLASGSGGVQYFDNSTGCKALLDQRGDWGLPMVCGEPLADDNRTYCLTHLRVFLNPHQEKRSTDGKASQSPGSRNFR